jgi:hypothetical protein
MPVVCSQRPNHLGAVHVVGGQVGQRAAAVVVVVDPHRARRAGHQRGMAAAPGLDGGLLVGRDHIVVAAQWFLIPHPVVEVEHPLGFGGEVGIGDEDPRPVLPGFEGVLGQPAAHRRRRDGCADARGDNVARQLRAAPPRQRQAGMGRWRTRRRLDRRDLHRAEHRWPAAAVRVAQRRHPWRCAPAAAPLAHSVLTHVQRRRDVRVRLPLGGGEHDLGPCHQPLLGAPGPNQASQCATLRTGQRDPGAQ